MTRSKIIIKVKKEKKEKENMLALRHRYITWRYNTTASIDMSIESGSRNIRMPKREREIVMTGEKERKRVFLMCDLRDGREKERERKKGLSVLEYLGQI